MATEILINVTPPETRVALIENGVLQELFIERNHHRGLVGNLYKGRVCRVLPGMQAAFVDIGLDRAAFLHASDIARPFECHEEEKDKKELNINALLQEGQDIIVQVIKDPLGTKGARLTTQLSIPSRYTVLIAGTCCAGISQKVEEEAERLRLKDIITRYVDSVENCGFIVRTAAEGVSEEALVTDMNFLHRLWQSLTEKILRAQARTLIHEDLPLLYRILRDMSGIEPEKVKVDSKITYRKLISFTEEFVPEITDKLQYYPGERPIFDLHGVEDEIKKALDSKVQLKSGGHLVIDQTEAMTTIDVNTGAFVGHRNLEETIFKTNLEASQAIARQLRLRNLGGIIIIDFIDMLQEEHKRQVLRALEKSLEKDHAKTNITEVSTLGLVEMTRKRTRESLGHILCEPCPSCGGRGTMKTPETVCYEIFREILREARQFDASEFLVLTSDEVVDLLLDEESTNLAELEEFIGKPIKFRTETLYTQEQFDVVLM
ncbi:MAG: ribonuclease G [Methylococcales bacterium]|jgi:ribonuclease G|nr:ribonuclease G [Methylococcales bacterium]MBT7409534.1 ribonuclease G [Methylococcales bacterium]